MELKQLFAPLFSILGIMTALAYGVLQERYFPVFVGVLNLILWAVELKCQFNCRCMGDNIQNELLLIGTFSVFSISLSSIAKAIALGGSLTLALLTMLTFVLYRRNSSDDSGGNRR
ncbi:hypothetical protein [Thermococcus waiotapuensis]|uniref:Uncharacterized protein n=1 Tax=Thermococcus waiotapuensis TaxID=90909 RepID=A0AAE4T335_9EURY|nr:hypothetical protein [Thermococcus waiotapuensis]MDV3104662.1 hypothetical protein [Thermococcus waiotapuensis]